MAAAKMSTKTAWLITAEPPTDDDLRYHDGALRISTHITQRMLTLQPRALEQDGIVARAVHNSVPPHVEYSFTRKGLTLGPILDAMEAWGEVHRPRRRRA